MFENIIGQQKLIRTLSLEISGGTFPHAVLYCGPPYAGKLSTALETARLLTCERNGDWSCTCTPCAQHRLLLHPYTVLTGPRLIRNEFRAARDVLERTRTQPARFLFLRSVRKLTRRFDAHIFHADDSKRRLIQDTLLALEDELSAFDTDRPPPQGKAAEKLFSALENLVHKLEGFLPRDNIPIAVIRNITQWASFTAPSAKKIVIIESASRMQEASRNALLKTLEEPPADTHFILTAERPDDLIPTIRSRLRVYRFQARTREETSEVLTRVFREDNPEYKTLKSYFLAWEDIRLDDLHLMAQRFAHYALQGASCSLPEEFPDLFRRDASRELYHLFLEELMHVFKDMIPADQNAAPAGRPPLERIEAWTRLVRSRTHDFSALNLSPSLFVESLYTALKDAS
jgi:DNA polymerase III delta prime subunit